MIMIIKQQERNGKVAAVTIEANGAAVNSKDLRRFRQFMDEKIVM